MVIAPQHEQLHHSIPHVQELGSDRYGNSTSTFTLQQPGADSLANTPNYPGFNGPKAGRMKRYTRTHWHDYLAMACLGALGLGIYLLPPAPNRLFPLAFSDGEVVFPTYAYPLRTNIIPIWLAALLAFFGPALIVLLMQIRYRSLLDVHTALFGVLYSLVTAAVFQVFIKWLIGGLRPHFYAVCKPSISPTAVSTIGQGYQGIMVDRSVCTGDNKEINDSLESFPSGHSTAAFAGFVFLSLYINSHLKVVSGYSRPAYWKFVLFFAPLLAAVLIAGSLTIDEYHHWYDVMAGAAIGTATAFAAYRAHYAAIWDPRRNDVPLPSD